MGVQALYSFFGWVQLPPEAVGASEVLAWVQHELARGRKPAGVLMHLRRLKRFYEWEGLVWPGRGVQPKQLQQGWVPEGLPEPDPEWDD